MAQTLFDKIWYAHAVVTREDGTALLWTDRHLVHDGEFHAFGTLQHAGCARRRPDLTFGVADHYAPSHVRTPPIADPKAAAPVAPDDTTLAYLHGRPRAPEAALWDTAVAAWRLLPTDPDAVFDREVSLDATDIAPTVTWGNALDTARPVTAVVPHSASAPVAVQRAYVGLTADRSGRPWAQPDR